MLSQRISDEAASYLDLLVEGGSFEPAPGRRPRRARPRAQPSEILERGARRAAEGRARARPRSTRVIRFAELAGENLDFADAAARRGRRSRSRSTSEVVAGERPSLDTFAIAVAATITLMFVTVLLVAGSLALEREENAFARLTRGAGRPDRRCWPRRSRSGVLRRSRSTAAAAGGARRCSSRSTGAGSPLIVAAIVAGGAAFAAFGAAIGAPAREVRASSLLAFMISLPIAFLSLVPVGDGRRRRSTTVIEVVTRAVPLRPGARRAARARSTPAGPDLGVPLLHLPRARRVAYGVARPPRVCGASSARSATPPGGPRCLESAA